MRARSDLKEQRLIKQLPGESRILIRKASTFKGEKDRFSPR
jgi:hypothetical protein